MRRVYVTNNRGRGIYPMNGTALEKGQKVTEAIKSALFLYLTDTDQNRVELAARLGCSHSTIVNWLNGRTKRIKAEWWNQLHPLLSEHFGPKFEQMLKADRHHLPDSHREPGMPLPSSKAMVLAWIYDTLPDADQERFDVELREAEYKYRVKATETTNSPGGK